jgi:Flp pilus assembly protein TadG
MKIWRKIRKTEGQSLVELALTLPLLLVMFVGLVEVGAALRNYLVVVNANREGTRFAARGRWLDSAEDVQEVFKRLVASAGVDQRGEDLIPFLRPNDVSDLPANTAIAVTYITVSPQFDGVGTPDPQPAVVHGPWITGTLPSGANPVDGASMAEVARQNNEDFNREYFINQGLLDIPSEDNFIIVEVWYTHEQLLKLPFFTELLPETFTLYAQSTMRVTLDSRVD